MMRNYITQENYITYENYITHEKFQFQFPCRKDIKAPCPLPFSPPPLPTLSQIYIDMCKRRTSTVWNADFDQFTKFGEKRQCCNNSSGSCDSWNCEKNEHFEITRVWNDKKEIIWWTWILIWNRIARSEQMGKNDENRIFFKNEKNNVFFPSASSGLLAGLVACLLACRRVRLSACLFACGLAGFACAFACAFALCPRRFVIHATSGWPDFIK